MNLLNLEMTIEGRSPLHSPHKCCCRPVGATVDYLLLKATSHFVSNVLSALTEYLNVSEDSYLALNTGEHFGCGRPGVQDHGCAANGKEDFDTTAGTFILRVTDVCFNTVICTN